MAVVVVWHFNAGLGFMRHGYLAVDCFFIMSGFFLYRSAIRTDPKGSLDYTLDKIKRFYPEILLVLLPCLIVSWPRVIEQPERLVNDLFFVASSGVFGSGWNAPLWFIHVMVLAGAVLYPLVRNYGRIALTIILPLVVLLGYTFLLSRDQGRMEVLGIAGPFDLTVMRGTSGMSWGILVSALQRARHQRLKGKYLKALDFLSVLSAFAIIVLLFVDGYRWDRYILLFFSVIILECFQPGTLFSAIFKSPFWEKTGRLSFEVYLVHFPVMKVMSRYLGNGWDSMLFVSYLVLVLIAAILLKTFYTRLFHLTPAR